MDGPRKTRSRIQLGELSVCDGILLLGKRIVIPKSLHCQTLEKIHEGHQGISRCCSRAQAAVWWQQCIVNTVKQCVTCIKKSPPAREPLITTTLPSYPWQRVATDLFIFKNMTYLLVVDYFSCYPVVIKLGNITTSTAVISALKSIFSQFGIPETVMSDNGPQYASQEFCDFSHSYNFSHITSSPYYPQSNGLAERGVRTVKQLLTDSSDVHMALLNYRSTPLPWCNISPAELLMGRKLRNSLPSLQENLIPQWSHLNGFREADTLDKRKQKINYDLHYRTRPLPPLADNTDVYIRTGGTRNTTGRSVTFSQTPRSYEVRTDNGTTRRNRRDISSLPNPAGQNTPSPSNTPFEPISTRTRTGTPIRPPDRLTAWRKGDVV